MINKAEKLFNQIVFNSENRFTFAITVPVLHTIRTACGSFLQVIISIKDNTPPMPLNDAHLGGLFIL